ncbi:MaoC family dehydratase [Actinokineospora auranticolor]|uniref:Acyl dehydratase n=1 Tax=Actinokineospora auranticolor TaxID=155976 RepID=A0A2S6H0L4_9PSEU|nr:MaoC family dehydratase [Actinokineospora auranticolor]PPK70971.1 acyl dehydratase [Actinokineospora auranticolor]
MIVFDGLPALTAAVGTHLGFGEWVEVTQERVRAFADATGDHQWIHLDAERAADGPFGGTVAHGYLTLSLLPALGRGVYRFAGFSMGVNYGLNKVRFPGVVRVGSRVRVGVELRSAAADRRGVIAVFAYTVEVEGSTRPGCVAEAVVLLVP